MRSIRLLQTALPVMLVAWASPALAAQTPTSAAAAPDTEDEIVVLARRAKTVLIKFHVDDRSRAVKCRVAKSSGDKVFDGYMCEPVRRCAGVNPFTREVFAACLKQARTDVLREYLAAHPRK